MEVIKKSLTTLSVVFIFFSLFFLLCSGSSWGGGSTSAHITDELLVKLRPGMTADKSEKLFMGLGAAETGEI